MKGLNMDKLLKELRRIINDGVRRGKSKEEIQKELNVIFKNYGSSEDEIKSLTNKMYSQYDWLKSKTISDAEKKTAAGILERAGADFARTKKGIIQKVKSKVLKMLDDGSTQTEIRNELESVIGKARNYAETISRTAVAGFSGADNIKKHVEAGTERFTFAGPPAERPFCQNLMAQASIGKTWTLKEIRAMSNGQGLPVELYCGGYNCRHQWMSA
jgi:hypothetical protein